MSQFINRYLIGDSYRIGKAASREQGPLVSRGTSKADSVSQSATEPTEEAETDTGSSRYSHLGILQKLIPGEAISVYFLAQSLSASATDPDRLMNIAAVVAVGLAAVLRILLTQDTSSLNPWRTVQWRVVTASASCCVIWIYAIGGAIFVGDETIPDIRLYAQILGFVFAALAPFFFRDLTQ